MDKTVTSFLWGGKTARVRKSLLQKFTSDGGLALPNFLLYYWSAQIQKFTYWLQSPKLLWCKLETQLCFSSTCAALLTSSLPINTSSYTSCNIVLSTLRIWFQFRLHFKFSSASTLMPIVNNHLFPPSVGNISYVVWQNRGIKVFRLFQI